MKERDAYRAPALLVKPMTDRSRGGWKLDGSDYAFLLVAGIPLGTLLGTLGARSCFQTGR